MQRVSPFDFGFLKSSGAPLWRHDIRFIPQDLAGEHLERACGVDVWKRGCCGLEYKAHGDDLKKTYDQILRYAGALKNQPLLLTSDMERISVRTNWTNAVSERREFAMEDLCEPVVCLLLKACWTEPLVPSHDPASVDLKVSP